LEKNYRAPAAGSAWKQKVILALYCPPLSCGLSFFKEQMLRLSVCQTAKTHFEKWIFAVWQQRKVAREQEA